MSKKRQLDKDSEESVSKKIRTDSEVRLYIYLFYHVFQQYTLQDLPILNASIDRILAEVLQSPSTESQEQALSTLEKENIKLHGEIKKKHERKGL